MFITNAITFYEDNQNINERIKLGLKISNFLLAPARYLFNGKSVSCYLVIKELPSKITITEDNSIGICYRTMYSQPEFKVTDSCPAGRRSMALIILAIISFIPGTVLGCLIRKTVEFCSEKSMVDRIKRREASYNEYLLLSTNKKLIQELEIGISLIDDGEALEPKLAAIMNKLPTRNEKEAFIKECTQEHETYALTRTGMYRRIVARELERYL